MESSMSLLELAGKGGWIMIVLGIMSVLAIYIFFERFNLEKDIEGNSYLYLGTGNQLYYPSSPRTINAFRAYFQLNGITAADINPNNVKMFFGDGTETGIIDARGNMEDGRGDGVIYNIAGQRLNKPQRGINIVNGRKVVIK